MKIEPGNFVLFKPNYGAPALAIVDRVTAKTVTLRTRSYGGQESSARRDIGAVVAVFTDAERAMSVHQALVAAYGDCQRAEKVAREEYRAKFAALVAPYQGEGA